MATKTHDSSRYFSAAETAKLIRVVLKKEFPATKFSVRSETYSMGASVRIAWMDGPTPKRVDEVVEVFNGKGFDGMIDMAYTIDAWVHNGEILGTCSTGTEGSRGIVPAWGQIAPHDDAELVHFGCSVSTSRRLSPAFCERLLDAVAEYWGGFETGRPVVKASDYDGSGHVSATPEQDQEAMRRTGYYWSSLVHQASHDRSRFTRGGR